MERKASVTSEFLCGPSSGSNLFSGGRRTFKQPPSSLQPQQPVSSSQRRFSIASTNSCINHQWNKLSLRTGTSTTSGPPGATSRQTANGHPLSKAAAAPWRASTFSLSSTSDMRTYTSSNIQPKQILVPGATVICVHSKEMAIVKFVGRVSFGEGTWLGLELKTPRSGRHDGCVDGRRYFTCAPNRGVMLKPKMVSLHGINGAKLVKSP